MQQPLAFIPSPSNGVWHLGPLPIRGYALMIILGVVVAVWLGERRWRARGGGDGVILDIAVWAVPFGLVGARLYHVITDWQLYFGDPDKIGQNNDPIGVFEVWHGGLGIWGGVAGGVLGAWLACRSRHVSLRAVADAVAPGVVLAQGIGRWGNWFNQELFGRPTTLPWAVEIDPDQPNTIPGVTTYQPTFLYECLWCIGVAVLVIWAERRFRLTYGRAFALYVAGYTVGRFWIEALRIDTAHHILGLRLNDWTSIAVFLAAVAYMYVNRHKAPTGPSLAASVPSTDTVSDTRDATRPGGPVADVPSAERESTSGGGADVTRPEPIPARSSREGGGADVTRPEPIPERASKEGGGADVTRPEPIPERTSKEPEPTPAVPEAGSSTAEPAEHVAPVAEEAPAEPEPPVTDTKADPSVAASTEPRPAEDDEAGPEPPRARGNDHVEDDLPAEAAESPEARPVETDDTDDVRAKAASGREPDTDGR